MIFTPFSFIKSGAAPFSWTPADLPGLEYWWESSFGVTQSLGDTEFWDSKVGNVTLLRYGIPGLQYIASEPLAGGKPALYQNGSYNALQRQINPSAWAPTDDWSVITIGVAQTTGTTGYKFSGGVVSSAGVGAELAHWTADPSNADKFGRYSWPSGLSRSSGVTVTNNLLYWHSLEYDVSAGTIRQYINSPTSANDTQTGLATSVTRTTSKFEVGGYTNTFKWKGYTMEYIFLSEILSDADRTNLDTYVTNTYS